MIIKTLEVRDGKTFIPVVAIQPNPRIEEELYLWSRGGYGKNALEQADHILLCRLDLLFEEIRSIPIEWSQAYGRTLQVAHQWIQEHWHDILNGQVIDVEYIMKETDRPKISERISTPQ
jgi:hypothetical protein